MVGDYFNNLKEIGRYIKDASNPSVEQSSLDERYQSFEDKYERYTNEVKEYDGMFYKNKSVNSFMMSERSKTVPDILITDLGRQAIEQFIDYRCGLSLRKYNAFDEMFEKEEVSSEEKSFIK